MHTYQGVSPTELSETLSQVHTKGCISFLSTVDFKILPNISLPSIFATCIKTKWIQQWEMKEKM